MDYLLFANGIEGGLKVLRTTAGYYSFKKKVTGNIYVAGIGNCEPLVRTITPDEDLKLKRCDRVREGELRDVFAD